MESLPPAASAATASSKLRTFNSQNLKPTIYDLRPESGSRLPTDDAALFQLRVISRTTDGRWLFDSGNFRFSAVTRLKLMAGQIITVRFSAGPPPVFLSSRVVQSARLPSGEAGGAPAGPLSAEHQLAGLIRALGLPQDGLSLLVVQFFRAWALKLSPAALKTVRSMVLRARHRSAAADSELTAAALAAYSGGVELTDEALAAVAADANPGRQPSGGDPARDRRSADKKRQTKPKLEAADLRRAFETHLKSGTALSYLNCLPGISGKHWLVIPIKTDWLSEPDSKLTIVLRLLLTEGVDLKVERLALELVSPLRRWQVMVDQPMSKASLVMSADPALGPMATKLQAALSASLQSEAAFQSWEIRVEPTSLADQVPELAFLGTTVVNEAL